jgi:DNA repair protein REV1
MPKTNTAQHADSTYPTEDISESFLNELPEDIRAEILAEQKRNRMKARSGLNYEGMRKKTKVGNQADANGVRGQQTLQLPKQPDQPTFTSQKLSSLPELRDATSAWVREFSIDEDGPDEEDVSALSDYLSKVVAVERDMAKAVAVVNWLALVIEYENFKSEKLRRSWETALSTLTRHVQLAVEKRGLPPVVFDF